MFVIDVVFRYENNWGSSDAGERGFADDEDADMRTATHDHHSPLLEDYDYGVNLFIN